MELTTTQIIDLTKQISTPEKRSYRAGCRMCGHIFYNPMEFSIGECPKCIDKAGGSFIVVRTNYGFSNLSLRNRTNKRDYWVPINFTRRRYVCVEKYSAKFTSLLLIKICTKYIKEKIAGKILENSLQEQYYKGMSIEIEDVYMVKYDNEYKGPFELLFKLSDEEMEETRFHVSNIKN